MCAASPPGTGCGASLLGAARPAPGEVGVRCGPSAARALLRPHPPAPSLSPRLRPRSLQDRQASRLGTAVAAHARLDGLRGRAAGRQARSAAQPRSVPGRTCPRGAPAALGPRGSWGSCGRLPAGRKGGQSLGLDRNQMQGETTTKFLQTKPPGPAALPPAFSFRSAPAALLHALPASRSAPRLVASGGPCRAMAAGIQRPTACPYGPTALPSSPTPSRPCESQH